MGLFKKKDTDPLSERQRALNAEIAALEAQINSLKAPKVAPKSTAPAPNPSQPRLRPATLPHGSAPYSPPKPVESGDPIFEEVDQSRLKSGENGLPHDEHERHYNDLGVRKYDLGSLIQRIKNQLKGPTASNPRFVNYLAAGSVQGLRPLRYEKRVARNRTLFVVGIILAILVGAFLYMFHHN